MARHCQVTGLSADRCDCGACDEQDDEPAEAEPWRDIPFTAPPGIASEELDQDPRRRTP